MTKEILAAQINSLPLYNKVTSIFCKNIEEARQSTLLPELLFITSYPPRVCGIATYTQDLVNAMKQQFGASFSFKICALEKGDAEHDYTEEVKYRLHTAQSENYEKLANELNADRNLKLIYLEHEFGLFGGDNGIYLLRFLSKIKKPVITTFHTVLPNPDLKIRKLVEEIVSMSHSVVVMTNNGAHILENKYDILPEKINIIPHGTHLISSLNKNAKKAKIHLRDRFVLSTFGLLSANKSIETALDALPKIVAVFPNVIYLIIGKTHPEVVKEEGEKYREFLHKKVVENNLQDHVLFVNEYLPLESLLEYLQRTNIYLFTSKNPNQAVSGTLAYAMSCGCPIISTPIPHANELLDGGGVNFDFQNPEQLADAAIKLIADPALLAEMRLNALHKISPTAWQNSAIAHIELAQKKINPTIDLQYAIPEISLQHIRRLTTSTAMVQFSKISVPDLSTGYTLDDNARALIAVTKHYELTSDIMDVELIEVYLNFIINCQQADGSFLNYMDIDGTFFEKNHLENLEDSNGRAIWALGEFLSYSNLFSDKYVTKVTAAIDLSIQHISTFQSPRAIAFVIKGLHHYNVFNSNTAIENFITSLADNLVSKHRGVSDMSWDWYEDYLTYANSLLPEAMLYAWLSTGNVLFKNIAKSSFDFLLNHIFKHHQIKVVSNRGWHQKGQIANQFGEQPIDIAYTILALDLFYQTFNDESYLIKMQMAFNWFLGKNHLHQIIYNPCTGGCYDGLEEQHVNLNQGAESTVSYLLARLLMEKYFTEKSINELQLYREENDLQLMEYIYCESML